MVAMSPHDAPRRFDARPRPNDFSPARSCSGCPAMLHFAACSGLSGALAGQKALQIGLGAPTVDEPGDLHAGANQTTEQQDIQQQNAQTECGPDEVRALRAPQRALCSMGMVNPFASSPLFGREVGRLKDTLQRVKRRPVRSSFLAKIPSTRRSLRRPSCGSSSSSSRAVRFVRTRLMH